MSVYGHSGTTPLIAHSFHNEMFAGRYLMVQPQRGKELVFRIHDAYKTWEAIAVAKRRGYTPLYVVRVTLKRDLDLAANAPVKGTEMGVGKGWFL